MFREWSQFMFVWLHSNNRVLPRSLKLQILNRIKPTKKTFCWWIFVGLENAGFFQKSVWLKKQLVKSFHFKSFEHNVHLRAKNYNKVDFGVRKIKDATCRFAIVNVFFFLPKSRASGLFFGTMWCVILLFKNQFNSF